VADPRDVDPVFGDLAAFDTLLADAHARSHAAGLAVTLDLVPNQVSSRHAWFQAALAAPAGKRAGGSAAGSTSAPAAACRVRCRRTTGSRSSAGRCWVLSNHDRPRHRSRCGAGPERERRARAAALLLLALPGVAYVYNGDELGLPSVVRPDEALQDPACERTGHSGVATPSACRCRGAATPRRTASAPGTATWLPMPADWTGRTVQAEEDDRASTRWLDLGPDVVAFDHDGGLRCVVNFGPEPVALSRGQVLLSSAGLPGGRLPRDTAVWLG